jgi:hypothetical protein
LRHSRAASSLRALVIDRNLKDDDLIVLIHFAGDAIKNWAVISIHDGLFHHRSEFTFFSLKGALKHFCELAGEDLGDSIDDYCW